MQISTKGNGNLVRAKEVSSYQGFHLIGLYSTFQSFCNFSEDVALPEQDMLHREIFICDCNAIIS